MGQVDHYASLRSPWPKLHVTIYEFLCRNSCAPDVSAAQHDSKFWIRHVQMHWQHPISQDGKQMLQVRSIPEQTNLVHAAQSSNEQNISQGLRTWHVDESERLFESSNILNQSIKLVLFSVGVVNVTSDDSSHRSRQCHPCPRNRSLLSTHHLFRARSKFKSRDAVKIFFRTSLPSGSNRCAGNDW